jgi:phage gp37-like protein
MSAGFRVDYVESALVQMLTNVVSGQEGQLIDVQTLGKRDFDEDGALVLQPPCLRVIFLGSPFQPMRDNTRLNYQRVSRFEVLSFAESLRGPADQRLQSLALVAIVEDQLAGARLTLADGTVTMPLALEETQIVEFPDGPVPFCYSTRVAIESIAQFSGANA